MTKLKDLPEGTLLINGNGRKGLYSNNNAPSFIMELGDKKATVLWQGTSRYEAFMHSLTKKGNLEKNVDYVLPEDVGMYLPTPLEMGSFMPSDADDFCSKLSSRGTDGTSKGTTDKYYVKLDDWNYLNVDTSGNPDSYWEDGIKLSDNCVAFEASKMEAPGIRILFTPSEYNSIAEEINQDGSWDKDLPLFDPDNPMFEKAKSTTEPNKEAESSKEADKYYVKLDDSAYLNVDTLGTPDDYWIGGIKLSGNRTALEASKRDTPGIHTLFTPSEYNSIAEEINQDGSWDEQLPLFDPDNPMFEKVKSATEPNKETDKYYVKLDDLGYLNVGISGEHDNYWPDAIKLSDNRIAFESSKEEAPWVHTLFTPNEYNSIAEEINQDGSWDEQLPLFDPDNPMFEKAKNATEPNKEKHNSKSTTLDEPTFRVHVGNQHNPYNRYLNVQKAGVETDWSGSIILDDGRVVFVSDDFPYQNVQIDFTLAEYKDIYNKVNSMNIDGDEPFDLPEYDSSNTDAFELVHGESLPEDTASEKLPNKEPKFMVQITSDGKFLNEELMENTLEYLRGTANGDQAYLLNGYVLFLDDDSNDDMFKTHFTLKEYNDLREQVSFLEDTEDLSWSLPEYSPENDRFILAEGRHLPGYVKESNKRIPKLPQWVKDILDNLTEYADDPTVFTKEINTLVQFMGVKNWGFYLYQKVQRMQNALKNHSYNKKEAVAASKLIVKEAKKYY